MPKVNLTCLFNTNELLRVDINRMEGAKKITKKEKEKESRTFDRT